MTYTDEDEQRVYEATNRAVAKEMRSPSRLPQDEFMRHIARVALDAMEREPLENVLRDTRSWLQHLEVALQDDGQFACTVYGYEATVKGSPVMDATRYGADPAEAIHNAIAAAQEER